MKTLFQLFMTASLLLIMIDISACGNSISEENSTLLFGQSINMASNGPVGLLLLSVESTDKPSSASNSPDILGNFVVNVSIKNVDPQFPNLLDTRHTLLTAHQKPGTTNNQDLQQLLPALANP